jgi:2-polyprenyl-3-methyl-5-hydroxy-6-metoxy-1,4-benzoquinol methylase
MSNKNKLNNYNFGTSEGFYSKVLKSLYFYLSKYYKGDKCLELGCADGAGTKILLKYFKKVVAVDGSSRQIELAKTNVKNNKVHFVCSYFEALDLSEKFDTIVLAHVLEHVEDPILVLRKAKSLLKKDGIIIIDVPNAQSLHRQAGVRMGLLKDEYELNDSDKSVGHRRVYDKKKLAADIKKSRLYIVKTGGFFLKAFSNEQLDKIISEKDLEAFGAIGVKYPDIAAEIYFLCSNEN